jgi:hypothetical protein
MRKCSVLSVQPQGKFQAFLGLFQAEVCELLLELPQLPALRLVRLAADFGLELDGIVIPRIEVLHPQEGPGTEIRPPVAFRLLRDLHVAPGESHLDLAPALADLVFVGEQRAGQKKQSQQAW